MNVFAYLYTDPLIESSSPSLYWGQDIDRLYHDLGGRQQLQALRADCQKAPPDCLLVQRLEDLGDSPEAVIDCATELMALGLRLIVVTATSADPVDHLPQDQTELLRLLQGIQQYQQSRRIRQGHARNRLKAVPPPGKAPYGYRRGKDRYALDRTAATIVKDFFEQFLLFGSLRRAVRYLEKKHGKKISTSTGHRWLTNPVYRGDLAYQNGETIPNTHVAILSREEAAQVDRLLRRNRRLPPRTASAPRSLAGLVTCHECQSPLVIGRVTAPRRDREYLYLRPASCSRPSKCPGIPYEQVLEQTIERICTDLPRAVAELNLPNMDGIKQGLSGAIQAKEAILNQLPNLVAMGILDEETANLRAYKVRTEIATLQAQIDQLPPANLLAVAQTVAIPQFWRDLSEAERRFYFREFIRQIQLLREEENWQIKLLFIF